MEFIEKSRKLTSSTGFIKRIETGAVYDYSIYLGKFDSPDSYVESSEEEFQKYLADLAEIDRKMQEEAESHQEELIENPVDEEEPIAE